MSIDALVQQIGPLDEAAMQMARARQDTLTKPQGSLGRLETLSVQVVGMSGQAAPQLKHKAVVVMAGDHGVTAEGVSAYPSEVTVQMVANFLHGGAAINVLARQMGARVTVVDMGVAADLPPHPELVVKKIAYGTANIVHQAAMSREQAIRAVLAGAEVVEAEIARGLDILATGDMGIGNTTPSAAIAASILEQAPVEIVGRGTGVDEAGLQRKIQAVERAMTLHHPNPKDALDVLAKVGGVEIGGLAGAMLAAAAHRRPVLLDGFISTAAALLAVQIAPQARSYLIAAHRSQERGHRLMLEWLGLEPLLDLNLHLGEGTGAVLALPLVEAACRLLNEMATFGEASVSEEGGA
ncbi:MAG: nicotinate-nucleotide--dimethylbenzimidazole phosphoribosyltransferase [Kiritimatiellota bacterium]|nr:nicotinate-nucleotide--dimethylbenzimidazole phosphoribosyltransferase [Kiritimatiellota bacterium]